MNLMSNEKKFLIELLKEKLEHIKDAEKIPDQKLAELIEEKKWEDFIKGIIKKLS